MALNPELAIKLVFTLGITNIISLLLVLTSCRCMGLGRLTSGFFQYTWYQKYYQHHCFYWWIFIISVLLHSLLAFYAIGNPF